MPLTFTDIILTILLLALGASTIYLKQRILNLAKLNDIGAITQQVEEIRRKQNEILELTKQRHELRMVAVNRRLSAHQEAYTRWWGLMKVVHQKDKVAQKVMDFQSWFVKNRLYLEPEVAQALNSAFHAAFFHRDFLEAKEPKDFIRENWEKIQNVGEIIVRAVKLPELHEKEYSPVKGAESAYGSSKDPKSNKRSGAS